MKLAAGLPAKWEMARVSLRRPETTFGPWISTLITEMEGWDDARFDQAPQESQQAGRRVVRYLPEDKAIDWQGGGSSYGALSRRKDIMGLGRVCCP
jgi:hypothetical protein